MGAGVGAAAESGVALEIEELTVILLASSGRNDFDSDTESDFTRETLLSFKFPSFSFTIWPFSKVSHLFFSSSGFSKSQ